MTDSNAHGALASRRVLIVEDEYFLADDLMQALEKLGAEIVGPASTREKALALLASESGIDLAVLDINLRGSAVYPVADVLTDRGIPFVFATGYDEAAVPAKYNAIPRWEKPFDARDLAKALPGLMRDS